MSTQLSNDPTAAVTENATPTRLASPNETEPLSEQPNTTTKSYPRPESQYEEIAQNPELFLEKLQAFHRSFGTKFKVPTVGGKPLDLHRLFVEVASRGGIEKVISDRKWKEVIVIFKFPSSLTSASFVLRNYYLSLLYHFEQVYYFRKDAPPIPMAGPVSRSFNGSTDLQALKDGTVVHQNSGNNNLEPGSLVSGTIDGKFDYGYLITVNMGSEKLKGVLYHTSMKLVVSQGSDPSSAPPRRRRKKYQLGLRDYNQPKPNRIGFNYFFAEHYDRLKPLYRGQEQTISRKIGLLWSRLTEAEKQVYREKEGLRDQEQYGAEMLESRSSNQSEVL